MVNITTANKIAEIKTLREHSTIRYGFTVGLKEAKAFIDDIQAKQEAANSKERMREYLRSLSEGDFSLIHDLIHEMNASRQTYEF